MTQMTVTVTVRKLLPGGLGLGTFRVRVAELNCDLLRLTAQGRALSCHSTYVESRSCGSTRRSGSRAGAAPRTVITTSRDPI